MFRVSTGVLTGSDRHQQDADVAQRQHAAATHSTDRIFSTGHNDRDRLEAATCGQPQPVDAFLQRPVQPCPANWLESNSRGPSTLNLSVEYSCRTETVTGKSARPTGQNEIDEIVVNGKALAAGSVASQTPAQPA